jgi:GT2 family glycosyltransferase
VAPVLAALAGQFATGEAELVLVDNRRSGDATDFVRAWREVSGRPPVRVVRAIRSGLAYARNLGLGAACGTWVVYLDDDTLPAADWLTELKAAINAHPECAVIGGAIAVRDPEPRPWWWRRQARRYWAEYHPHCGQFHFVERWRQFPHGGNWATRRAALLAIGGFREQFGHHGGRIGAGEEVLAALQLQRLGGRIGIAPAARVVHCVAPQRMTLSVLWHTLRAGWGVRLHLETGLYIERVTSPLGQLKDVCLYSAAALHPRLNRFQRIERLLWAAVSLVLLKDFARIQISRLRRSPVACAAPRQQ